MATMENLKQKGQNDVINTAKDAVKDAQTIGAEIERVKSSLADMPDSLDPELTSAIQNADNAAREEARRAVDDVIHNQLEKSRSEYRSISSDVNSKITDNNAAMGKLDSAQSGKGYGSSEIAQARRAIEQNSAMGEGLIQELEQMLDQSGSDIESIKSAI